MFGLPAPPNYQITHLNQQPTVIADLIASRLVQKGGTTVVLAMSRPSKHPATGIYQFRKAVPLELRELVGKSEVKVSLGSVDKEDSQVG